MFKQTVLVMFLVALVLAACGSGGESAAPAPSGNAENGKTLLEGAVIGASGTAGCIVCHSLDQGTTLVGPSLAGIGDHAAAALKEEGYGGSAKNATEWLQESIVNPDVDVAEGFQPGIMPPNYGDDLSQQEVDDLVAYLATLK